MSRIKDKVLVWCCNRRKKMIMIMLFNWDLTLIRDVHKTRSAFLIAKGR